MDRVFLDANALFSAAWSEANGLLRLWSRRGVRLIASGYVIEEARRNLAPGAARDRLAVLLQKVEPTLDGASPLDPRSEARLPESDRPVLRAAITGRATHLLSGDRRAFGPFYGERLAGVLILRPADYLRTAVRATRK